MIKNENEVYIFGGETITGRTGANYVYTDEHFQKIAPMILGRYNHGCVLFGKDIYIIGGSIGPGRHLRSVEIYNIDQNSWRNGPQLPNPLSYVSVVNNNGVLFVLGGFWPGKHYQKTIYMLDNENWELVGNMERSRYSFPVMVVNEKILSNQ